MIPDKVKIGAYNYSIAYDPTLGVAQNSFGRQSWANLTITLDSNIVKQALESTFLHEILEAINCHHELKLEHQQITVLEAALYQVLHDNKLYFGDDDSCEA